MSRTAETVIRDALFGCGLDQPGRVEVPEIMALLKAEGYRIVKLPQPYEAPPDVHHPYWSVEDINGPQVVGVTESDCEGVDWVSIQFSARYRTVDTDTARALGAAFLAAAEVAEQKASPA